jgi:hypothetical protein
MMNASGATGGDETRNQFSVTGNREVVQYPMPECGDRLALAGRQTEHMALPGLQRVFSAPLGTDSLE